MNRFKKILITTAVLAGVIFGINCFREFTNHSVCTATIESMYTDEQKIVFRYKWSWDGKPHDFGTDLIQLEWDAVNSEGNEMDCDSSCSATVFYQTRDGEMIQDEIGFEGCAKIPMKKKLENHAGATVSAWAQGGMIEVSASAPQRHTPLGLLRIHGLYGHQKQGMWIKESEVVLEGQELQLPEGYTKMAEVQMKLFADGTLKNQ